jgi:hypothetical protein
MRPNRKIGAACLGLGYGTTWLMVRGTFGPCGPGLATAVLTACMFACNLGSCLVGISGVASTIKVRTIPSWPRSWANFSLL